MLRFAIRPGWVAPVAGLAIAAGLECQSFAHAPGRPLIAVVSSDPTDLDAFMKRVLAARDDNWKKLQQYVLDESQRIDMRGPSNIPLWGDRREYTWFLRDGFFVESPVSVNGVAISDTERRHAEDDYLRQAKARDRQHGGERGRASGPEAAPNPATPDVESLIKQTRQPGFVDAAYFLRFKFEAGTYALVGRETFDGLDVLRVEYYPTKLFSHEENKQQRDEHQGRDTRSQDQSAAIEQMMNKAALITLWIEPKAFQIVKYTFDNVNVDFFPGAWLFRVTAVTASMTMSQPIVAKPEIWLPHDLDVAFGAMLALGPVNVRFHIDDHDYREATTSGRIKTGRDGGSR